MTEATPDISHFTAALATITGARGWLSDPETCAPYYRDWLRLFNGHALGVARPSSTQQVADIITLCARHNVEVIPQSGNTSLLGGSVPVGQPRAIVLSVQRMNKVLNVDPVDMTATVEAGCILQGLHEAVAEHGLMFPLYLGSQGTCQIGGNIATNAGGTHVVRYGSMQDLVLGLEVVLSDGRIWNGLRTIMKDNMGYQLKRLFCGSEGTLGVITRATLKLFPLPRQTATAMVALASVNDALMFATSIRRQCGEFVSALEFTSRLPLDIAFKHLDALSDPLADRYPAYLLIELTSTSELVGLDAVMEDVLSQGFETGVVLDGTIAANEAQTRMLWDIREGLSEGQRLEGPQIKHDISVPVSKVAEFIERTAPVVEAICPGCRVVPFGHIADGNIHYNLSIPEAMEPEIFDTLREKLSLAIYDICVAMGGSISAEHGVGKAKTLLGERYRPEVETELMQAIKRALDPDTLLNPEAVVRV